MLCISLLRCIVLTSSVCGYCSFLSVMRKLDSLHWQRWSLNSWQSTKQTWLMTQETAAWTKMQRVIASQTDNYNAGTISRQYKPVLFISPVVLFQRCLQCLMSTVLMPPVLWRCWFGGRKGIRPVKKLEWSGAGVVICLEWGADLHTAQLMPLPLTVSCFSKIQIGFTFLVPAHLGSPGQRAVKHV